MPRTIPEDYFSRGSWAAGGPLRFTRYTCVPCGAISHSWESFQEHRRACTSNLWRREGARAQGSAAHALNEEDRASLADLIRQVKEADAAVGVADLGDDHAAN